MLFVMAHTDSKHSEILPNASRPRKIGLLSHSAQPRYSGPALPKWTSKTAQPVKLLAAAAVIAAFSAALALSPSSQRLEAQTDDASPEPEIQVSGRQSLSSVPSDAVRLYYNCAEDGEVFSPSRHSYVRVFSSRNQSSCSGYEQGDYILRAFVEGYFPGLYYPSGTLRFDVDFVFHFVGDILDDNPEAGDADRVDGFDYFVDGTRRSVSPHGCGTDLASRSLSFGGSVFETALLCRDAYWQDEYMPHWEVPGENTAIHMLPSEEFTQWPLPLVQVIRLEVTQGVQNWNNDLTLVRNRRTVVRAFMETATGRQREITARLEGQKKSADDTALFVDTTDPVNPGQSITVMPNAAEPARRGEIDASLNFVLPSHWTDLEADEDLLLELVFELGSNARCLEGTSIDLIENRCVERVEFVEVVAPDIVMVPLIVEHAGKQDFVPPDVLEEQYYRIMSIMPLPDKEYVPLGIDRIGLPPFTFGPFERTEHIDKTHGLLYILKNNAAGRTGADVQQLVYLGVLEGDPVDPNPDDDEDGPPAGSSSGIPSSVASWYAGTSGYSIGTDISSFGRGRHIGSHELGHVFNQRHPADEDKDGKEDDPDGDETTDSYFEGECGEDPYHKIKYPDILPVVVDDKNTENEADDEIEERPVLGPLGDVETEVWGLDTRFVDLPSGVSVPSSIVVTDPRKVFSFMSYCDPVARHMGQGRWMDAFHHERIITHIDNVYGYSAPRAAGNQSAERSVEFSGAILFSSDGEPASIELNSVFSKPRLADLGVSGEYTLELLDDTGSVLRSVRFAAVKSTSNPIPGSEGSSVDSSKAYFSFFVSDFPEYASFAITKNGKEISAFSASSNAPSLSLSGPTSGQTFDNDDNIMLSWSGSDPDGDALTYRVYYSTDGGITYEILAIETDTISASIPANALRGSSRARLGVSASDGYRASFAETPVFSVAGHAPEIKIQRPLSGMVFSESQGFLLDASGYDIEDGGLSSGSFNWSSSIDGNLGTGSYLVLSADNLTPGAHTITLTATDSDNTTATATVNITITERNMLPVANDDEAFGGLEEMLRIDVLANDIDIEGDFDLSTLTIYDRPRLGIAEVSYTAQGLPVIEYSPFTGGEDSFSYYICDGLYRCDTAEVVVVFPDCTITGTRGSDSLVGTSGDDVICGLDGDDFIDGKAGNDLIYAGFGEDVVAGRTGDDTVYGGPGNDLILGHRGDDTIYGGLSNDRLYGGGGDDTILGGAETDELYGEADDDILYGGDGPDTIHGGQGNDVIYGGSGDDTIRGNAGADTIYPGSGNNSILGRSPEDTVS